MSDWGAFDLGREAEITRLQKLRCHECGVLKPFHRIECSSVRRQHECRCDLLAGKGTKCTCILAGRTDVEGP
jgi:hypothetical protein